MNLKRNAFVLFALLFIAVSCKDDEPAVQQDLSTAELSFKTGEDPVAIPSGLLQSTDPNAQQAVVFLEQANGMADLISSLQPPTGATKSSTPINGKSSNGGRTEVAYVVYTWTSGNTTIAYQISETSTEYIFELFWKLSPDSEFLKYLHAEESKLGKEGFLNSYDPFGTTTDYLVRYQWNEVSDGTFYFDLLTQGDEFTINIVSNPDNSGSVKYYVSKELYYDIAWNADGSGSWILYDFDGTVNSSGSWN
jgi:hypothetical protein